MKYYMISASGISGTGVSYNDEMPDGAVECTQAQYEDQSSWVLVDGSIVAAAVPTAALSSQATTALDIARAYVRDNYTILNEATPDIWVTYLKSLMAIANGTDTISTTLPTRPASP